VDGLANCGSNNISTCCRTRRTVGLFVSSAAFFTPPQALIHYGGGTRTSRSRSSSRSTRLRGTLDSSRVATRDSGGRRRAAVSMYVPHGTSSLQRRSPTRQTLSPSLVRSMDPIPQWIKAEVFWLRDREYDRYGGYTRVRRPSSPHSRRVFDPHQWVLQLRSPVSDSRT